MPWMSGGKVVEPLLTGSVTETPEGNSVVATVTSIRFGLRHVLVDTGGINQRVALQRRLESLPPVTSVILTHFHWDHCGNLALFPGIPIYAMTEPKWFDRATLGEVQLMPTLVGVHEGDIIEAMARIIAVPGHTANHIAVEVSGETGSIVMAGDAISDIHDAKRGTPHFAFYSEDQAQRQVARLLDRAEWIIPGHGEPFEVSRL